MSLLQKIPIFFFCVFKALQCTLKKNQKGREKKCNKCDKWLYIEILVYPSVTNCNKPKVYDECFMRSCCQDMESL